MRTHRQTTAPIRYPRTYAGANRLYHQMLAMVHRQLAQDGMKDGFEKKFVRVLRRLPLKDLTTLQCLLLYPRGLKTISSVVDRVLKPSRMRFMKRMESLDIYESHPKGPIRFPKK